VNKLELLERVHAELEGLAEEIAEERELEDKMIDNVFSNINKLLDLEQRGVVSQLLANIRRRNEVRKRLEVGGS